MKHLHLILPLAALTLTGCSTTGRTGGLVSTIFHPATATATAESKTGSSSAPVDGGSTTVSLVAPTDPAAVSQQTVERTDDRNLVVMAPTETVVVTQRPNGDVVTTTTTLVPTIVPVSHTLQKTTTLLSASQHNTAADLTSKLSSFHWVQYIGIVLMLCALSMFYPPIFFLLGENRTLQLGAGTAGLTLIFLPVLIVGNERLLLIIGLGSVGALVAWHFLVEHGKAVAVVKMATRSPFPTNEQSRTAQTVRDSQKNA